MRGENRPGYRAPLTGEKRRTRQPLRIDKLDEKVRDAIRQARAEGKTWAQTAEIASLAAGKPLAASSVHRWFYLQAIDSSVEERRRLQQWKKALDGRGFTENPEETQRILAAQLSEIMANGTGSEQVDATRVLLDSEIKIRRLKQEDRRLDLESKKLDAVIAKVRGIEKDVQRKRLSNEELAKKFAEIYDLHPQAG